MKEFLWDTTLNLSTLVESNIMYWKLGYTCQQVITSSKGDPDLQPHIYGLGQDCSNSIANAQKIP